MKALHSLQNAGRDYGWALALLAVAGMLVLYATGLPREAGAPGTEGDTKIVPTTGEAGYPVDVFCSDPATTVTRSLIRPDSTYKDTYTLDRSKGGVHETVTVGVYADAGRQPVATHYDSANNTSDAFVSVGALNCIENKAR